MKRQGSTITRIQEAVRKRFLTEPFRAANVNEALHIDWAGTFLPKHAEDNPGGYTVWFVRVTRGLYRLV